MSSATEMITKAKAFDPTKITYETPVTDSRGGKKIKMRYHGKPIVIQIPLMFTWGTNERVNETSGRLSYDLSVVFQNSKSLVVRSFCEKLKTLEKLILEYAANNSKSWFGKSKLSIEVAEAMMYSILKYPKNKDTGEPDYTRDPNLKIKLPYWEGRFNLELYDMKSQPIFIPPKDGKQVPQGNKTPLDLIPSRSHIKGLIVCNGIWMAGGRFGVTWKLIQAQVRPPVQLVGTGVCHLQADSDDDEMLDSVRQQEEEKDTISGPNFSDGDNDDDDNSVNVGASGSGGGGGTKELDDDDDDDDVPVVTKPVVKKKKKRVIRRKNRPSS